MLAWRGGTSYNMISKIISTIYLGKERAQDGDVCVHQEDCGQDNAYYYDVDYSVMFIEPSSDHFMKMQRHKQYCTC